MYMEVTQMLEILQSGVMMAVRMSVEVYRGGVEVDVAVGVVGCAASAALPALACLRSGRGVRRDAERARSPGPRDTDGVGRPWRCARRYGARGDARQDMDGAWPRIPSARSESGIAWPERQEAGVGPVVGSAA